MALIAVLTTPKGAAIGAFMALKTPIPMSAGVTPTGPIEATGEVNPPKPMAEPPLWKR
jgi:hypothetical protein